MSYEYYYAMPLRMMHPPHQHPLLALFCMFIYIFCSMILFIYVPKGIKRTLRKKVLPLLYEHSGQIHMWGQDLPN